jgi:phenylacetyl-CoA:acceptor oxidoreductase subunit 2
MTRESYAAVLTFAVAGATLVLIRSGDDSAAAIAAKSYAILGLSVLSAVAASLFLYCQARILKASKGIPAWREPKLMRFIIVTGLTEGLSALLILMAVMVALASAGSMLTGRTVALGASSALTVLLALRIHAWQHYFGTVSARAPIKAVEILSGLNRTMTIWGGWLPLGLSTVSLVGTLTLPTLRDAGLSSGALVAAIHLPVAVAMIMALGTGWQAKFVIIARASYTQGFSIPKRPARGPRGSGGIGTKPGWD